MSDSRFRDFLLIIIYKEAHGFGIYKCMDVLTVYLMLNHKVKEDATTHILYERNDNNNDNGFLDIYFIYI